MQALKALVISLGVLILLAFGFLVYGLLSGAERIGGGTDAPAAGFGEAHISIPKGARVVETEIGDGRLFLRLEKAGGGEAILVVDPATGERSGVIHLIPSPEQ